MIKMIHFIYVILETDAYFYSCYYDVLDRLYSIYQSSSYRWFVENVKVSLFWDSDQSKHTILQTFSSQGIRQSKIQRSIDLSTQVSTFVNSQPKEEFCIFSFYVHGNIWFLRHCKKIITLQSIVDKFDTKFQVFLLESCYCASIENCVSLQNKADVLVTSECTHAKCSFLDDYFVSWLDTKLSSGETITLSPYECGVALSESFIRRINSFSFRDIDTLSLVSDIAVIDLTTFSEFYKFILTLQINRQPISVYKRSKVYPKRDKHKLGYDLWTLVKQSYMPIATKQTFESLFKNTVRYYRQSKWLQRLQMSNRLHGLCWSPAPYDSDYGWTYKLIKSFEDQDRLLIY